MFVGDISSIRKLYDGNTANEYFYEIQKELKKQKIEYNEIVFPGYNLKDYKKLIKSQIPLESYITFTDFFNLGKIKNKDEFKAYIKLFEYPNYQLYSLAFFYNVSKKMLEKIKPNKIILTCSYTIKYAMIVAAKELGIETIELQHGSITEDSKGYFLNGVKKYVLPDYFISYSKEEEELLTKKSFFGKLQMLPLGCPRYDFLNDYKTNKKEFIEKYNISKDKKILFWATQPNDKSSTLLKEDSMNVECVFSTLQKKKDWFLIIKLHPRENYRESKKIYELINEKYNIDYLLLESNQEITYDCIYVANATIIKHTTVGMESILMNKPVINFELVKNLPLNLFTELSSKLIIKKKKDLSKYLNLVLDYKYIKLFKKERKIYVKNHFANFGSSSKKIVEHIK